VQIGLCFMAPTCNVSEQITCHRYKPRVTVSADGKHVTIQPVKISPKPSHYKVFSSIFNGSFTDSHM
jgi:hypothetical protein